MLKTHRLNMCVEEKKKVVIIEYCVVVYDNEGIDPDNVNIYE